MVIRNKIITKLQSNYYQIFIEFFYKVIVKLFKHGILFMINNLFNYIQLTSNTFKLFYTQALKE